MFVDSVMDSHVFSRYSKHILLTLLCLLPIIGWGSHHAYDRRDNSVLGWLPERSPVTQAYQDFLRDFGPDETIFISWDGCTLDNPLLERLAASIEKRQSQADSSGLPRWFASVTTGTRLRDQIIDVAAVERRNATERLRGALVGPDGQTTCCVVTLFPLDDASRQDAYFWLQNKAVEQSGKPRDEIRLTGDAVIGVAIDIENERTTATWSNLAMGVALLVACLSLGSLRLGVMVIAVAGVCSLSIEALVYFSGTSMNMLVTLVPAVTFVLSISAGVHLVSYWNDEVRRHGIQDAPAVAVSIGWQPGSIAMLTTVLGMLSLCVSQVRPVWEFGIFAALGASLSFLIVFSVLPALLQVFPPRKVATTHASSWPVFTQWIRRLVARYRLSTGLCLGALILGCVGLYQIHTEVRPARFLPPKSHWIEDLQWFNTHITPFQTIDAVLVFNEPHTGLSDRAALTQETQVRLMPLEDIRGTISAATFLPDDIIGFADRGQVQSVIRRGVVDGRLRRNLERLIDTEMVAQSDGQQLWRISLRVANFTAQKQQKLEGSIREIVARAAAFLDVAQPDELICTGGVPLVIAAQRELLESLLKSFAIAFVTIVGVLSLFLRSPIAGTLAMIPNILPPICVFGVLGWLGRPLDVGGMMTASVALGISVDDTAHLLTWFKRAGKKHPDAIDNCIDQALVRSAVPITRTSLILGFAFAVFALCDFQPISQFGYLLASLLGMALVGDLIFLPALLAGPTGRLFGRHMQ